MPAAHAPEAPGRGGEGGSRRTRRCGVGEARMRYELCVGKRLGGGVGWVGNEVFTSVLRMRLGGTALARLRRTEALPLALP